MATYKCSSCGGTYDDVQRDGALYRHVCGPIPNPAFNPIPGKGAVDLRETLERANKRDENATRGLIYDAGRKGYDTPHPEDPASTIFHPGPIPIVSEGAGRTAV
jgi:hypothetical protein